MPISLALPDTMYSSSNMPALCFNPLQRLFYYCSHIWIVHCCCNSSDQGTELTLNMVAVTWESGKCLSLTAMIGLCLLYLTFHGGNYRKNVQSRPYFRGVAETFLKGECSLCIRSGFSKPR